MATFVIYKLLLFYKIPTTQDESKIAYNKTVLKL